MATLALGFLTQGAPGWLSQVAVGVGSMIDQRLFGPKTHTQGPRLDDLRIQGSSYGSNLQRCFGNARLTGNIIWGTNYVEHEKTEEVGGKGGGNTSTTYTYSISFAVAICKGPVKNIKRVWADGKECDFFPQTHSEVSYAGADGDGRTYIVLDNLSYDDTVGDVTVTYNQETNAFDVARNGAGIGTAYFNQSFTDGHITFFVHTGPAGIGSDQFQSMGINCSATVSITKTSGADVNVHYGTESQLPDEFIEGIEGAGNVPAYRGLCYIVFKNINVSDYGNRIPSFTFEVEMETNSLSGIITEICTDAGLSQSKFTIHSNLSGITVPGYTTGGATYREMLQPLQTAYLFDGVEQGGKILFKQRTYEDVHEISLEDMGTVEGDGDTELYKCTRTAEQELPRSYSLSYIASDANYQQGCVVARRTATSSVQDESASIELVMTDSWAKQVAEAHLYEKWINRTSREIKLPIKKAYLVPGQVLHLNFEDRQPYCMISKVNFGKPGIVTVTAFDIGKATYNFIPRTIDTGRQAEEYLPPGIVKYHFLDLPILPGDKANEDLHCYFVATATNVQTSRLLKQANSSASSFDLWVDSIPRSVIGVTLSVLPHGPTNRWDRNSYVDIQVVGGTLESKEEIDVLNGANAILIGDEIVQFTTATLKADGVYRLSGLLRGRMATEYTTTLHVIGERVVLLNPSTLRRLPVPQTDWFVQKVYRVGPASAATASSYYRNCVFTSNCMARMPFPVCHVKGERDITGTNLTVSWKRRTRGDGAWKDYVDVPLNEAYEEYEADIYNGDTVVRTLHLYERKFTYHEYEQIEDFGAVQSSIRMKLYQISESRGRGLGKEVIL